jgi:hypothetical protein
MINPGSRKQTELDPDLMAVNLSPGRFAFTPQIFSPFPASFFLPALAFPTPARLPFAWLRRSFI